MPEHPPELDRYQRIYRDHADLYQSLVAAEDADGALLPALAAIAPLQGARVLEVGAGTGRLTRLLEQAGARVLATEPADAMARVGHQLSAPTTTWIRADARRLPVARGWADIALAGWVFGHFRAWWPDAWRSLIGDALDAMTATLRPGGRLILIETLGTGHETPTASPAQQEVHDWFATERGLTRAELRTDYAFASPEQAVTLCGRFFGDSMAERVRQRGSHRVPECTGLWHRTL